MTKILMSIGSYYPETTGGATHIESLISQMKDEFDFLVLSGCSDARLAGINDYNGARVYRIKGGVRNVAERLLSALRMCIGYFKFGRFCDILHAHGFTQNNVILSILAKITGKKILFSIHTAEHDDPFSVARSKFGWIKRLFFRLPDRIICISPGLYRLSRDYGIGNNRLILALNGVDTSKFRPAADREKSSLRSALSLPSLDYKLIAFIGYMIEEKGLHLLLEAWSKIRGSNAKVKILAVCPQKINIFNARYSERINGFAQRMGLCEDIIFMDKTLEIEKYLMACDLFVLPSYREGMPNVLLEAMASGLACIAARLPGATDFLIHDGTTGILFERGDSDNLAGKLKIVLQDEELRKNLGVAARESITKDYDMADTAKRYAEIYASLRAQR